MAEQWAHKVMPGESEVVLLPVEATRLYLDLRPFMNVAPLAVRYVLDNEAAAAAAAAQPKYPSLLMLLPPRPPPLLLLLPQQHYRRKDDTGR